MKPTTSCPPCLSCACRIAFGRCLHDGRVYDVRNWQGPCPWKGKGGEKACQ